jgi:hypothetical protein
MSLQRAIHHRWRTSRPLAELLPAAAFFTGAAPPAGGELTPARPYATLRTLRTVSVERTSGGRELTALVVRFRLVAEGLDAAKRIADAVQAAFERSAFADADTTVQDMRREARRETRLPGDLWRIELDFLTRVETEA